MSDEELVIENNVKQKKFTKIRLVDASKVEGILKNVLYKRGERLVEYKEGWDDSAVADALREQYPGKFLGLKGKSVGNFRVEHEEFGNLVKYSPAQAAKNAAANEELENRVSLIEESLLNLNNKVDNVISVLKKFWDNI